MTTSELIEQIRSILASQPRDEAVAALEPLLSHVDAPPDVGLKDLDALPNGAAVVAALKELAVGSGPDGSTSGVGARSTWANQLANQTAQPLQITRATSLMDGGDATSLVALLSAASSAGNLARAIGSGHSYSDVATTPDCMIDTHGLNRIGCPDQPIAGQLDASMLMDGALPLALSPVAFPSYDPARNLALVEMEGGITLRTLNPLLDARNVGLKNMGGYDGQTMVGAISTSTHGSGIGLQPFPDMVRSLVLATTGTYAGTTVGGEQGSGSADVRLYRIEPSAGITDPDRYQDPHIALVQDDDCFQSVVCGMGCFGVIYSVVLEVMQRYWLKETRSILTLGQLMTQLAPDPQNPGAVPDLLADHRHVEALIQPYPIAGCSVVDFDPDDPAANRDDFLCLLTVRDIVPEPTDKPKPRPAMPDWVARLLSIALHLEPAFTPFAVDISLATLVDEGYVNASHAVFDLGLAGGVGVATEIGFSLEGDAGAYTDANFRAAIDTIHRNAQRARVAGEQYQTSPFSLRFVAASDAHLSMMQGQRTAMIEMDLLTGTLGTEEILYRYQTSVRALGARPHWGLEFDVLTGSGDRLASLYPMLGKWLATYRQLNAAGTFVNRFSTRMGFDSGS